MDAMWRPIDEPGDLDIMANEFVTS